MTSDVTNHANVMHLHKTWGDRSTELQIAEHTELPREGMEVCVPLDLTHVPLHLHPL